MEIFKHARTQTHIFTFERYGNMINIYSTIWLTTNNFETPSAYVNIQHLESQQPGVKGTAL